MARNRILDKLEHDLSHFLIEEATKSDPSKRGSPEMYKYKGLNINADEKQRTQEKTVSIRIGALEAEFKIDSCEKNSGCLAPEDERLIKIWMAQSENNYNLRAIFGVAAIKKEIAIVPFDLENFYNQN